MSAGATTNTEQIELLEEALEHLEAARDAIRAVGDEDLEHYVIPQLEGHEAGWLGKFLIDHVNEALRAARDGDEDHDTEDDEGDTDEEATP